MSRQVWYGLILNLLINLFDNWCVCSLKYTAALALAGLGLSHPSNIRTHPRPRTKQVDCTVIKNWDWGFGHSDSILIKV